MATSATYPTPVIGVKIKLPTRKELGAMWEKTAVQITVVVCATVICLAAMAGTLWLTFTDRAADTFGYLALGLLGLVVGHRSGERSARKNNGDPHA